MRAFLFFTILLVTLSCSTDVKRKITQGNLENFVSDTFIIHRDEQTGYLSIRGAIHREGKEYIYTFWNNKFLFFDSKTGKKSHSVEIPKEGPGSIRGVLPQAVQYFDENIFMAYGQFGDVHLNRGDSLYKSFQLDREALGLQHQNNVASRRQKISQISSSSYELSNDPFDLMSFSDRTSGFDIENFGAWIAQFDDKGNWICVSDFKAPFDKSYGETLEASDIMRITENGISWSLFPFSDSLYQTENCKVTGRFLLESATSIKYFPSKEVKNGNTRIWVRPENAGMNLHLLNDPESGIKVRMALLEQKKGGNEDFDPRRSMYTDENIYLILIYDKNWQLTGELKIAYQVGTRFENLFISDGHLFINKPEQASEYEYEFYKIDLSRFKN